MHGVGWKERASLWPWAIALLIIAAARRRIKQASLRRVTKIDSRRQSQSHGSDIGGDFYRPRQP